MVYLICAGIALSIYWILNHSIYLPKEIEKKQYMENKNIIPKSFEDAMKALKNGKIIKLEPSGSFKLQNEMLLFKPMACYRIWIPKDFKFLEDSYKEFEHFRKIIENQDFQSHNAYKKIINL